MLSLDQYFSRIARIASSAYISKIGIDSERGWRVLRGRVNSGVTCGTKGYQVVFCIRTRLTAEPYVVNLQVRPRSTELAFPAIPPQYFVAQHGIIFGVEVNARSLPQKSCHVAALSAAWSRNRRLYSPGRNVKKRTADRRRMSGSRLSRLAPARKSAQIISKQ
jgi:hypothetical protein